MHHDIPRYYYTEKRLQGTLVVKLGLLGRVWVFGSLCQTVLPKQSVNLIGAPEVVVDLAILRSADSGKLDWNMLAILCMSDILTTEHTLLAAQLCRIHSLAKHLDSQTASLLQVALFVVILLQQTLGACVVCTDTGGLPATVVATGV